jgi:hypothetical protein
MVTTIARKRGEQAQGSPNGFTTADAVCRRLVRLDVALRVVAVAEQRLGQVLASVAARGPPSLQLVLFEEHASLRQQPRRGMLAARLVPWHSRRVRYVHRQG